MSWIRSASGWIWECGADTADTFASGGKCAVQMGKPQVPGATRHPDMGSLGAQ